MAGFLRTIAQGIGSGLNRMAVGSTGGLLKPGEPGSRERRQNIGAGLADIGYLISSRGLGGSPYSQQLAGNRQAEQQALLAQQKERQALELQQRREQVVNDPNLTPQQKYEQLSLINAAAGDSQGLTATTGALKAAAPPEVKAPEIIDPNKIIPKAQFPDGSVGPATLMSDGTLQPVQGGSIVPGTNIQLRDTPRGLVAYDLNKVEHGQTLAEAEKAKLTTEVVDGTPYIADVQAGTLKHFVNADTGEVVKSLPKPKGDADFFGRAVTLRDKYVRDIGQIPETVLNISKLRGIVKSNTPISDIAATSIFNRILEPDSVTREAEAQLTRSARSAWDSLKIYVGKLTEGNTLTPEQVDDMLKQAELATSGIKTYYDQQRTFYTDMADGYGVPSWQVVGPELDFGKSPSAAPKRLKFNPATGGFE